MPACVCACVILFFTSPRFEYFAVRPQLVLIRKNIADSRRAIFAFLISAQPVLRKHAVMCAPWLISLLLDFSPHGKHMSVFLDPLILRRFCYIMESNKARIF